jgi:SAM-dependent methyltransferase
VSPRSPLVTTWLANGPGRTAPFFTPALECGLAHLASRITPGSEVLDWGCGRGMLSHALAAHGARVTAIDPDPGALAETRGRNAEIRCTRGDASRLPFRDGTFDALVSVSVLQYTDWRSAIAEAARVLRPGGRALFVENLEAHPLAQAYRALRRTTSSYAPWWKPRAHLRWEDRAAFDGVFAHIECRAMHLLTPLVLTVPALWPACARTATPPALGRLYASLARLDGFLLSRWPSLERRCWIVVLLAEKSAG